jgi:hypothetical protein
MAHPFLHRNLLPLEGARHVWPATGWMGLYVIVEEGTVIGKDHMVFEPLMGFVQLDDGTVDAIEWDEVEGPCLCIRDQDPDDAYQFAFFVHESNKDASWVLRTAQRCYEAYWDGMNSKSE